TLYIIPFFFQAEDGIRDRNVTGVQTCALPICNECFFRDLPLASISQITLRMDGRGEDSIPYATYMTSTGSREVSTLNEVKQRLRSEERRVGKECRAGRVAVHSKQWRGGERMMR